MLNKKQNVSRIKQNFVKVIVVYCVYYQLQLLLYRITMSNVFGLIVSGRFVSSKTKVMLQFLNKQHKLWCFLLQVQTDFAPLSETQFLITISEADTINHLVVFLTGLAPLPVGTVGMVYWSWPDPAAPPNWQLLGHISNTKPSAIFKIGNLKKLHELGM